MIYEFAVIASGPPADADALGRTLHAQGRDDVTASRRMQLAIFRFQRAADGFTEAIASALIDLATLNVTLERIEPDCLVTIADIAKRAGISDARVSYYQSGKVGEDFPPPLARVTTSSPLWDWYEVATWLHARGNLAFDKVVEAHVLKILNENIAALHGASRLNHNGLKALIDGAAGTPRPHSGKYLRKRVSRSDVNRSPSELS